MADYSWWKSAVAMTGGTRELTRAEMAELGIHEGTPMPGYYRGGYKGETHRPIAIWDNNGEACAIISGKEADPDRAWSLGCKFPIPYEVYKAVAEEGGAWPDEPPAVVVRHENIRTGARGIGDNLPDDPCEALRIELEGEREIVAAFLAKPIETQEDADKAATWAKRLTTLFNAADGHFKGEKAPILAAARECDDKWRFRMDAKELAAKLKRHMDDFLNRKAREEAERQRRAREEAERKAREAEEAAARASQSDDDAARIAAEEAAAEAEKARREAEARKIGAGHTGAKVALRTFVEASIVDYDKAVIALKDEPEMHELVVKLANRAVKAGRQIDGVERIESRRAA